MRKLTPKQASFVDHVVVCRNGAEAARRAGFAAPSARITASRLLTKTNVQAALAVKAREIAHEYQITKHRVISEIQAAIDVAKSQFDAGNMIRGWREIAKIMDLYKPEVNSYVLSASGKEIQARVAAMSDAELIEIAAGRGAEA